jgi:hypothetical protein
MLQGVKRSSWRWRKRGTQAWTSENIEAANSTELAFVEKLEEGVKETMLGISEGFIGLLSITYFHVVGSLSEREVRHFLHDIQHLELFVRWRGLLCFIMRRFSCVGLKVPHA